MHSWSAPRVPQFPTTIPAVADSAAAEVVAPPALQLYDTADDQVKPVALPEHGAPVGMYVCGITPYDSTHLGHAATYNTFDLVNRYLRAAGHAVTYVQNVTDVDDPLFERAERDGVDWRELGKEQTDLFRSDMTQLRILPPEFFVGAMETIDEVVEMVSTLLDKGAAYVVEGEYPDVYADHTYTEQFGYESRYDEATMRELFAERGGDPEREGKRHPLDALLWRAHRTGEPEWDAPFGSGRPGWHVECAAIAMNRLGEQFAIQGGGVDLRYPHHEYSAAHVEAACGTQRMAGHYVHTGMIGLEGTKMSKSLGNLEFVSALTAQGFDPAAIRVGLYAGHYRADRDWSAEVLSEAEDRLAKWRAAAAEENNPQRVAEVLAAVTGHLSNDLDTPAVLRTLDEWAAAVNKGIGASGYRVTPAAERTAPSKALAAGLDALLGVTV
ncbi:MAG TPA: cysteine--1-D-myo-inosityl 2-amino-2-deoxy-alpha-D-glucopyranoside ligase [Candidatus Corynebacterium intestinavium]|uniref:L-cysteine:1D-myo-inositol 2-amino-2-deoxy-alpha-D-glucopyranoside ligase n=1 Tax=Candidatus Corynebacterium intestinavium TaxID=2838531 RepID=A0A9D2UA60_9CORY|nr:cysteine--1-D-myo-inosityl 2-amino-2-deoxy-alpha-D-glucopyranoside ligase [Candidatus Corynebacterium intestinavium]